MQISYHILLPLATGIFFAGGFIEILHKSRRSALVRKNFLWYTPIILRKYLPGGQFF
jgi:hypothetical protein